MIDIHLKRITIYVFFWNIIFQVDSRSMKRSPLELGFVTFPEENPSPFLIPNKTNTPGTSEKKENYDISVPSVSPRMNHHLHEWLPGHIRNHAYIPAHVHQIFIPLLIPVKHRTVASIELYPRQFGGFGIGSYFGGQGAGHGFQIVFNN